MIERNEDGTVLPEHVTDEGIELSPKKLDQHAEPMRRALNGFLWLDNNRHHYGSARWLEFFDAAMEDARAAIRVGG